MPNFRSGFLHRGTPLGGKQLTVRINSNNSSIDTTGYSVIKIYSDSVVSNVSASAAGTTITVTSPLHGLTTGHKISVLEASGFATDADNQKLLGNNYTITVTSTNQFTYTVSSAPAGGPGTLDYVRGSEDRTFSLVNGSLPNHNVLIMVENLSQVQINAGSNVQLTGDWIGNQYDSLLLMWDADSSNWIEVNRGDVSSSSGITVVSPISGQILIYDTVDATFENKTVSGDVTLSSSGAVDIAVGAIVNADINAAAAVDVSKLAPGNDGEVLATAAGVPSWVPIANLDIPLTNGSIFVGDVTNLAAEVTMSGDVTIDNAGVAAISSDVIVNADVNTAAAIDFSKLATLTSGNILVGSAGNVATSVAMSGDATLVDSGALTIASNSITIAKSSRFVVAENTGSLTQAEILALNGPPIELVAAPGAGLYIVIEEVELFHSYSTAVYINGGILQIEYGNGTDVMSFPATVLTGGASGTYLGTPGAYNADASLGTGSLDITASINQNIRLTNLVAVFLNGDVNNILKYRVRYHVATAQT